MWRGENRSGGIQKERERERSVMWTETEKNVESDIERDRAREWEKE